MLCGNPTIVRSTPNDRNKIAYTQIANWRSGDQVPENFSRCRSCHSINRANRHKLDAVFLAKSWKSPAGRLTCTYDNWCRLGMRMSAVHTSRRTGEHECNSRGYFLVRHDLCFP